MEIYSIPKRLPVGFKLTLKNVGALLGSGRKQFCMSYLQE